MQMDVPQVEAELYKADADEAAEDDEEALAAAEKQAEVLMGVSRLSLLPDTPQAIKGEPMVAGDE